MKSGPQITSEVANFLQLFVHCFWTTYIHAIPNSGNDCVQKPGLNNVSILNLAKVDIAHDGFRSLDPVKAHLKSGAILRLGMVSYDFYSSSGKILNLPISLHRFHTLDPSFKNLSRFTKIKGWKDKIFTAPSICLYMYKHTCFQKVTCTSHQLDAAVKHAACKRWWLGCPGFNPYQVICVIFWVVLQFRSTVKVNNSSSFGVPSRFTHSLFPSSIEIHACTWHGKKDSSVKLTLLCKGWHLEGASYLESLRDDTEIKKKKILARHCNPTKSNRSQSRHWVPQPSWYDPPGCSKP